MKRILQYILTLLVIVFVIDNISYLVFKKFVFDNTFSGESGGNVNYLLNKNTHADFLIFGNSRAVHHIDPALLKDFHNGNGFNAGVNGLGGLIYNDLLLDLVIQNGSKPKSILMHIDPANLRYQDVHSQLNALSMFYDKSKRIHAYDDQFDWGDKAFSYFKLTRVNNKFINIFYNYMRPAQINRTGFIPLKGDIDTLHIEQGEKLDKSGPFLEAKIRALKNISQTCAEQNINLMIVLQPTYNNILYDEESNEIFLKLASELPNIQVFNFSDVRKLPQIAGTEFWKDKNHYNNKGSALFSNMLNEAIKHSSLQP